MKKMNLKDLQRDDFVVGGCTGLTLFAVSFVVGGGWVPALLMAPLGGYGVATVRHKQIAALQERANKSNSVEWNVKINGVKVGTVSDADYAAIRLQVLGDVYLYIAQLFNARRVLMRIAESMILSVPVLIFWAILGLGLFAPDQCASVLVDLRAATPAKIALFAGFVLDGMLVVGMLAFASALNTTFFGAKFGFVNCFKEAAAEKLRRKLGVAVDGDIVLVR